MKRLLLLMSAAMLVITAPLARAGIRADAGPYHVELAATPSPLAVGHVTLLIRVTDSAGRPLPGLTVRVLTKMDGMSMGEREELARPNPPAPGIFRAPAQLAMEGAYAATVRVTGPQGDATARFDLKTGEDTGTLTAAAAPTPASGSQGAWIPLAVGAAVLVALVAWARRRGGPSDTRAIRAAVGPILLIVILLIGMTLAVRRFRRPGSMTPLEAQSMQMELPAPPSAAPVELATVRRGKYASSARYAGQAVGFLEQEVSARVTGVILWMPLYQGDRVRRGQVVARLDTSQSAPQEAAQRAAVAMAEQGVLVARKDYEETLAAIRRAHGELGSREGALSGAKADVEAAKADRVSADSQLTAAQAMIQDAAAQLQGAQADQDYWKQEIAREKSLLSAGAVTREEYGRELAQAQNAEAKLRQAQARVSQANAQAAAAASAVRRADATIVAAMAKVEEAQSDLASHTAHVSSSSAMAASARQKILQAQAGVAQARAGLAAAAASRAYSEIRAEIDGVVTQRLISPGTLVNPGQTLLRIAQISPIRLQASVPAADLAAIRPGDPVRVFGPDNGLLFSTSVRSLTPAVDPTTRTGIVEAIAPNRDARLVPGAFVTLEIGARTGSPALMVASRALRFRGDPGGGPLAVETTATAWVAEPAGQPGELTVHERRVRAGASSGEMIRVLDGLKEGERVVVSGGDALHDGDTVQARAGQEGAAQ